MTLLQILSDTYTWRDLLQDINLVAQIIGVVLIIAYVIYTYKTFLQIKKQTDYQQDAFIKVDTLISQDVGEGRPQIRLVGGQTIIGGQKIITAKPQG